MFGGCKTLRLACQVELLTASLNEKERQLADMMDNMEEQEHRLDHLKRNFEAQQLKTNTVQAQLEASQTMHRLVLTFSLRH